MTFPTPRETSPGPGQPLALLEKQHRYVAPTLDRNVPTLVGSVVPGTDTGTLSGRRSAPVVSTRRFDAPFDPRLAATRIARTLGAIGRRVVRCDWSRFPILVAVGRHPHRVTRGILRSPRSEVRRTPFEIAVGVFGPVGEPPGPIAGERSRTVDGTRAPSSPTRFVGSVRPATRRPAWMCSPARRPPPPAP